ncbi:dipeptidase PepE [Bergeyella sp. RCAD1439]|uniref:dipeptidase PepE n=1 Tax=Bergeyella anatis TaxID=3113737 RepID=UPI002E181680|nr:dipeptidase PepE [Bergeyella sp. RCAD1439]
MNILLASTSTLYGENYLEYLTEELRSLFSGLEEILFIPYARPSGLSHDDYTTKVREAFQTLGLRVNGLHQYSNPQKAIQEAQGYFTGGGNTFLLVKTLHEKQLMPLLAQQVKNGKPYLGCSAGSNIGGVNMKTTNDMPIVYPPSFDCMALVPFNLNPHYLDPQPELKHNGETRETRIKEFLTQNDTKVIGLREGNWIRRKGDLITVEGRHSTRVFEKDRPPYEVEPGSRL